MSFAGGCAVAVTPLRATLKGQQGLLCVGQDELKDAATGWMPPAANVSTENVGRTNVSARHSQGPP